MTAPRKLDVRVKGRRYWATFAYRRMRPEKIGLQFWSDHKWPFYHASYFPDTLDLDDCWQKFMEFIPGGQRIKTTAN